MQHYSTRLERIYQDDDLLSVPEVLEVISTRIGREVSDRALSDIARIKCFTRERPSPRAVLYHYNEIKNVVVASGRGRPRRDNATITQSAIRQRKFRERQRANDNPFE